MPNLKREVHPSDMPPSPTSQRAASHSSHPPTPDLVQDLSIKRPLVCIK